MKDIIKQMQFAEKSTIRDNESFRQPDAHEKLQAGFAMRFKRKPVLEDCQ